jgi:hypothetical protein
MIMEKQKIKQKRTGEIEKDPDELSQADLNAGINTVEPDDRPHSPLKTADGKNNGAKPAAYRHQQSNRT